MSALSAPGLPWESSESLCVPPHHSEPYYIVLHLLTSSLLKVCEQSVALHVVDWTSNVPNILRFQHPIDHQCVGRLRQNNRRRSLQNPFAAAIEQSNSPEAILEIFQEREKAFKKYRDSNRRLMKCLTGSEGHSGLLRDTRRSGHPGKPQLRTRLLF